jgi:cell wall assembly regulator SMI1
MGAARASTIEKLDAYLRKHRVAYHQALAPGLDDDALAAWEGAIGASLPPDVRALYRWRDGQIAANVESLFDSWMFIGHTTSLAAWRTLNELVATGDVAEGAWRRGWIPIASNGAGDHLCVVLDEDPRGRVLELRHDGRARPKVAESTEKWLAQGIKKALRRVEEESSQSPEERYQDLLSSLLTGVVSSQTYERIVACGYTTIDELLGMDPTVVRNPAHRKKLNDWLAERGLVWRTYSG